MAFKTGRERERERERESSKLKGSVKELNMFHNYETQKITCKASDATENLQLYRVVCFFRPR